MIVSNRTSARTWSRSGEGPEYRAVGGAQRPEGAIGLREWHHKWHQPVVRGTASPGLQRAGPLPQISAGSCVALGGMSRSGSPPAIQYYRPVQSPADSGDRSPGCSTDSPVSQSRSPPAAAPSVPAAAESHPTTGPVPPRHGFAPDRSGPSGAWPSPHSPARTGPATANGRRGALAAGSPPATPPSTAAAGPRPRPSTPSSSTTWRRSWPGPPRPIHGARASRGGSRRTSAPISAAASSPTASPGSGAMDSCAAERLVAFSCKGRGVRQWVLSVPRRIRPFFHHDPALAGPCSGSCSAPSAPHCGAAVPAPGPTPS
jgi:hypothetical protein